MQNILVSDKNSIFIIFLTNSFSTSGLVKYLIIVQETLHFKLKSRLVSLIKRFFQ